MYALLERLQELYLVLEIADSDFKKLLRSPIFLSEMHIKTLLYNLLVSRRLCVPIQLGNLRTVYSGGPKAYISVLTTCTCMLVGGPKVRALCGHPSP